MPVKAPQSTGARAWCRADLAGGTLDIWPLGLLHRGARTINVALDLAVEVRLARIDRGYRVVQGDDTIEAETPGALLERPAASLFGLVAEHLDLPPLEARISSDSPRGAGLGASSALTVALLAAGEELVARGTSTPGQLAAVARDLEARLMSLPTGRQDHFPALLGGALEIRHRPGGESVRRLEVDLEDLAARLQVFYSGRSHFSAGNNWQIVRRRLDGEAEVARRFEGIAAVATRLGVALERGEWPRVGELMTEEWQLRRGLADAVSTPEVEAMLGAAIDAGAWGGKVCGAGGGGCMVVLTPPDRRRAVTRAVTDAGGRELSTRPAGEAIGVWAA